jgi:hypothetical protein
MLIPDESNTTQDIHCFQCMTNVEDFPGETHLATVGGLTSGEYWSFCP